MAKGKLPEGPPLKAGDANARVSMQQLRLIGRLIVAWSRLEGVMHDTIWALTGVDHEDGRVFTARADANRKIQWLRALARRHLSGTDLEALLQILTAIDDLKDDRNFVAHGSWFTARVDYGYVAAAASLREKTDPGAVVVETFPPERMMEITRRMEAANLALTRWGEQQTALRGKFAPPSGG